MRFKFIILSSALAIFLVWSPALAATQATQKGDHIAEWNAPDQDKAVKRSEEKTEFIVDVLEEYPGLRQQKLRDMGLGMKDIKNSYFWLNSPCINTVEDEYKPVRFMHAKHAASVNDCSLCHHARPTAQNATETTRCSACHQKAFNPDHPERIGLKAAYHIQCIGCHKKEQKGPIDCIGCHVKNPVDHREKIKLPEKPTPMQVTAECLRCHPKAGEDMLTSAHWLWKGPSPYTLKHKKEIQLGKAKNTLNNF